MDAFRWGPRLPGRGPFCIGILNLTPDSFSDGGRFEAPGPALAQAQRLAEAGAGMIDLGAESTRPGAEPLDPVAEWRRLAPVLRALREALPGLPLSVDTRHADVAREALAHGAAAINDVTGCANPAMLALAAETSCGLIAMRSRLREDRFWMPPYEDPAPKDAEAALSELAAVKARLLGAGIAPSRILLDPGFGFGTTYREDSALWEALPSLPARLDWPADHFCLGVSRKRFSAWHHGRPELPPADRDPFTAALHREAQAWGYRVFRTHAV